MLLRPAEPRDAPALAAIYAPYVRDTVLSFELEPPDASVLLERLVDVQGRGLPWLVAERDGVVAGYAYAGPHRARAAYAWSVETSIWIGADHHRCGIGRSLLNTLLGQLTDQGYVRAFAGVTLPNPGSVGLHEALGFTPVGVYHQAGYKQGAWWDVGWWERALAPATVPPPRVTGRARVA